jgi:ferredoxin
MSVSSTKSVMTDLSVRTVKEKCQGFGACVKAAPDAFTLGDDKLVQYHGRGALSDDELLMAARRCPYKAIVVVDEATQQQLHPRVRPPVPQK